RPPGRQRVSESSFPPPRIGPRMITGMPRMSQAYKPSAVIGSSRPRQATRSKQSEAAIFPAQGDRRGAAENLSSRRFPGGVGRATADRGDAQEGAGAAGAPRPEARDRLPARGADGPAL